MEPQLDMTMRLVVKRTFLQVECNGLHSDLQIAPRCRAMTDALIGYGLDKKAEKYAESESDGTTTLGDLDLSRTTVSEVCESETETEQVRGPPGTFHRQDSLESQKICWADCSPSAGSRHPVSIEDPQDDRTTLMFRNLPDEQVVDDFLLLLNRQGFEGTYDFAYMPMDFKKQIAVGYAFVNFASKDVALRAWQHFDGFSRWGLHGCDKVCEVRWSNAQQGVAANVDRYRNSPVMHESVADKHKPRLFVNGRRVAFPAPTEKIRPPKMRRSMKRPA
jgi:hypothetical protein